MQASWPVILLKRHYNTAVFLTVMAKLLRAAIFEEILWTAASEFFLLC